MEEREDDSEIGSLSLDHATGEPGTGGLSTNFIYRRLSGRGADAFHSFRNPPTNIFFCPQARSSH